MRSATALSVALALPLTPSPRGAAAESAREIGPCPGGAKSSAGDRVVVEADPRVALLGVLYRLGQGERAAVSDPFQRAVDERFARLRGHEAVRLLRQRLDGSPDHNETLRQFRECLDVELRTVTSPACPPSEPLRALPAFISQARFPAFLREQAATLRLDVEGARPALGGLDPFPSFERYAGLPTSVSYFIIPSRLLLGGGGPEPRWSTVCREVEPGGYRVTLVLGAGVNDDGSPRFELEDLRWHMWHQMAHAALDSPLERLLADRDRLRARLEALGFECYRIWTKCAREHVAQAVADRLQARAGGGPPPENRWLPLRAAAALRLAEYERQRESHPSLLSFMPQLLDALEAP